MRQDLSPDAPKLCHTCNFRESQKLKVTKDVSKMSIKIEVDSKISKEIEEICVNRGISLSEYFISLHLSQFKEEEKKSEKGRPKK